MAISKVRKQSLPMCTAQGSNVSLEQMSRARALIFASPEIVSGFNRPVNDQYVSQSSTSALVQGQYPCNMSRTVMNSGAPPCRASSRLFGVSHATARAQDNFHIDPSSYLEPKAPGGNYQSLSSVLQTPVPMIGHDQLLLDHFIDNILRLSFPVLEAHSRGPAQLCAILDSLKTNKSYFHCSLSVSAIHLKTTMNISSQRINHDIMRHRYGAVSQLCKTLSNESEHTQILDATLAMIFFHCFVGVPDDEELPDIPWHDHFQAAANLVSKLEESLDPNAALPFSMSLTAWIDILGATMLGTAPKFAPTYREKHLSGTTSGLREMMGCDDRIMYLISEIACLEALNSEGRISETRLYQHVSALTGQLDFTEPADPSLKTPYTSSGAIWPEQLTKNMSAVFRAAARIYLYTLLPGIDRSHPTITTLVAKITDIFPYIPSGPYGFDRSLVWPLLITGAHSEPTSTFRRILSERASSLGDVGDFGSFGRMYRLLVEVWRLTDEPPTPPAIIERPRTYIDPYTGLPTPGLKRDEMMRSPSPVQYTLGLRSIKKQQVQWRDVMNRNGWKFLLI